MKNKLVYYLISNLFFIFENETKNFFFIYKNGKKKKKNIDKTMKIY